jgi:glycosyltransferase
MKKIKIDVVVVPLSGHLFPVLNLLKPLLENPLYDIRVFTRLQRQQVTENLGFKVVPILENHVEAFEKVSNNSKKLSIFDAYRQLSNSLDLINIVSDQLIEEWSKSRPDIVIADFITLSGGLIAEQLQIPWITTMATQFAIETTDGPPIFFGGIGTPKNSIQVIQQSLGRRITRLGKRVVAFSLREKLN